MKNILILSGSPRKGGNSDLLCDAFGKGAQEAGHSVRKIRIAEKKIAPCNACYYCRDHHGECVFRDDMKDILQAMIDADVLVLASPVYFYSICGQLKILIDRTLARWTEVRNKEMVYILSAADEDSVAMDASLATLRGYADCVDGATETGVLCATGVYEKGTVKDTEYIDTAYQMGKNI